MKPVAEVPPRRRRSPPARDRRRDAERSRTALLEAALEEFSAKGFAGARVHEIAARAGVNKQLISYYFESKDGLYREVQRIWFARQREFADPTLALPALVARYVLDALGDPRLLRLMVWRGLSDPGEQPPDIARPVQDLSGMHRRQSTGELDDDLDVGCVLLAIMGMVAAPVVMPHVAGRILGTDPTSPQFAERYAEQISRIVQHLARCRSGQRRGKPDSREDHP